MKKNKINYFNPPYAVRNDCQIGQWKVGDDKLIGKKISLVVIGVNNYVGTLGKAVDCQWLQVFFVPVGDCSLPKDTVCVTYLKTRSLAAFGQKIIEIMEKKDPGHGVFDASFSKHSGEYGDYHSLDWEWREFEGNEELALAQRIDTFLDQYLDLVDGNLPPTMTNQKALQNPELTEISNQQILQEVPKLAS